MTRHLNRRYFFDTVPASKKPPEAFHANPTLQLRGCSAALSRCSAVISRYLEAHCPRRRLTTANQQLLAVSRSAEQWQESARQQLQSSLLLLGGDEHIHNNSIGGFLLHSRTPAGQNSTRFVSAAASATSEWRTRAWSRPRHRNRGETQHMHVCIMYTYRTG